MNILKCHNCSHEWEYPKVISGEDYPCGPCPVRCPNCNDSCCPVCGGEMGRSVDNGDEMDSYTSGGCHGCDYTCCGGCI